MLGDIEDWAEAASRLAGGAPLSSALDVTDPGDWLALDAALFTALGEEDDYERVLPPLLSARNPRVRSAGVTALRRAERSQRAEPFLSDRSALVRACARYVVRQHSSAGVRARAVAGLRALDRVDAKRLRPLLDDPAAAVVRETAAALLPSAKELPADWLLERTGCERPRHVRVGAFRLLDARGGIVALRAAVGLFEDPDVKLRTWAAQSAQRWRPSPDVRSGDPEVGELLDRCGHLFSGHVLRRRKWEAGVEES